MTTVLLVALVLLDIGLLAAVFMINRRQDAQLELVQELTEERRLLTELRTNVQEELEAAQHQARDTLNRMQTLAAEAEHEVRAGSSTIAKELEAVAGELTTKFERPLTELSRRQGYLETLLRKVDKQKIILQKLVTRGEKICRFFDDRVPYEEVLEEIEDKKYSDARQLLAKGETPETVARELGLNESEVRLVAGLAVRSL